MNAWVVAAMVPAGCTALARLMKPPVLARPGMPAKIRKLAEDDIDGLCQLWKEFAVMREGLTHSKILNEDAADYFFGYATGLLQRKDTLTLVAESQSKGLVGYLIATKQRRPPIYRHTKVAYLSDAFVQESHRGQGILRQFVEDLHKWCKGEGITAIDVQVFESNQEARDVYSRLGFHPYRVLLRQEVGALPPAPPTATAKAS
jgi:GNAT superfamily N-acetyltransferase